MDVEEQLIEERKKIMKSETYMEGALKALERQFGRNIMYPFYSAVYNVVVLGETSDRDDNPYETDEQPFYDGYHAGAVVAENLMRELRRVKPEMQLPGEKYWRN
jgi:hypothetical protein